MPHCVAVCIVSLPGLTTYYVFFLYTVSSVKATIDVISGRIGAFRVKCTSFGGKTFAINVEGPQYYGKEECFMQKIRAVGEPQRMGNDTYSATTSVISGGCNGDIYQCTASNGVAPNQTHSVELKGINNILYIAHAIMYR